MLWLRICWRSLWRNKRRSLINLSAIGLGLALVIFAVGLMDEMLADASARMDRTGYGHVQLHAMGYRAEQELALSLAEPERLLAALELPPSSHASARVLVPVLLSSAWGSRGALLLGVEPAAERGLSQSFRDIVAGQSLRPDDTRGLVLGRRLAERLKLSVGGRVRVMLQQADGDMGAELLIVRGIYRGVSSAAADLQVYTSLATARRLAGLGEVAHQIAILLPDSREADQVAAALRARVPASVEVLAFSEFLAFWRDLEKMMDRMLFLMVFAVYLLVGLGIANTMMMSVLERSKELGVMRALGTTSGALVRQVLGESAILASIGVLVGVALGLGITAYGAAYGLFDYTEAFGEVYEWGGMAMSMHMKTAFSVPRALQAAGLVWLVTVLIGLWPAWRVARLEPAEAIRRG